MINIETERLKLELITEKDTDRVYEIYSHEEVCRYYEIEPNFRVYRFS